MVTVFDGSGTAIESVALPGVFTAPIRPDLVQFVHTNMAKNARQAYAVAMNAGHQTSAESWGTGRAVSRIPRVQGGGTQRSGQGAFGNMCRGGRMFAPTKVWRKWHRKINLTQRRYAICSAVAASACPPLVMGRGHTIDDVPELPLVVKDAPKKTKELVAILEALGAKKDADRCDASKKLRAGKGKMRNRRYTHRKGPLVVHDKEDHVVKAARNLPGVDVCSVDRLNLLLMAPGGHLGRFVVWTAAAFAKLQGLYGSPGEAADNGYVMPRAQMSNADLARIINSDEIQSVVRPAKQDTQRRKAPKKNPLKNLQAMLALNPYYEEYRASEMRMQKARKEAKAAKLAALRDGTYVKSDEDKAKDADKAKKRPASRAFYKQASIEGDVMF